MADLRMTDGPEMPQREPLASVARTVTSVRTLGPADIRIPAEPPASSLYRRHLNISDVLRDIWAAREIVRTIAERDIRVRYKQAALGFAWSLLTPLGLLLAFTVLFHRAAHVGTGGAPYVLFAYVGLIPWSFFSTAVSVGGSSLLSDKGLLNKTYFPREVFPLASAFVAIFDAATSVVPLVVLFAANRRAPGPALLLSPLPLLVLFIFTIGVAFVVSSVIVYYRDVRLGLPLILQMGLFLTPVGYGIDVIPKSLRLPYAFLDPVAPVIDSLRNTVLLDQAPQWSTLGVATLSASVALIGGWALFKKLEIGFADVA